MPDFPSEAFWIGSNHAFDLHEAYLCFRSPKHFVLEELPKQAILNISADSRYKLWINGRFHHRGPNRCFPQEQLIDQLDITAQLQRGANIFAVQVYSPGYSHFAYVHRGAAGLLAWLACDQEITLVTDTQWRTWRDWSFDPLVPRVSIYGTGVEKRDMKQVVDWQAPGFDDSQWETPRICAPINGDPWIGSRFRELPLLIEQEQPLVLVEARIGKTILNEEPHLALRQGWVTAVSQPIEKMSLKSGETAYFLYDMGCDYTCQGWAEVYGAAGTETVTISYAEKIRQGDILLSDPQTFCRVRLTDQFRLRSGSQQVDGFTFRGGRYLLFQVDGPTGANFEMTPHVRISQYPLEKTISIETGDAELDAIVSFCEKTFISCLQDGFVDSTWRESSQWLGDALPQSLIMSSLSNDTRPLKQVLEMAASGAYPDGVLPSILPGEVHAYAVVDYNFSWVELLKLYALLTQDHEFIKRMWPPLTKMLNRFHQDLRSDGLIRSQPGRRLFLDWSPLSRQEPNAVYNFRYLQALQAAVDLAQILLETEDSKMFSKRAEQLQSALINHFWHDNHWFDDLKRSTFSQQAAAIALLTNTAVSGSEEALLDAIIARSLDLNDDHTAGQMVLASPFMHHYIFEAVRKYGRYQEALEIIKKRWGRWVKAGCPTAWENWNVDFPDGSQCHSFSAHPRYHIAKIFEEINIKTQTDT